MPAALTENGFVDNYNDALCLNISSWRNEVAKGFLHAMQINYGYAPYTPSASVTLIVDNSDGGFSSSANWSTGSSSTDKYGADYRYRSVAAVSDPANWNVSLGSAGAWTVYAWRPAGSNRSNNAPYFVYHSSGSSVIYCNQDQRRTMELPGQLQHERRFQQRQAVLLDQRRVYCHGGCHQMVQVIREGRPFI
jgi:hypothetical protein